MGEVYRDTNQPPIRLEVRDGNAVVGICQALLVPARRGRHLSVPYGPITDNNPQTTHALVEELKNQAAKHNCSFIRLSPFAPTTADPIPESLPSPLHLLAEHIWYIPLTESRIWKNEGKQTTEEEILKNMRKNTRNLIRRAEREGVTIERSEDPIKDLSAFIELHEETRKRHSFTPYSNRFFEAQVRHFGARNECTLYKALYQGEIIATSVHMHTFGETSYHHGASTHKYDKVPASYLLQWTAIRDALERKDHVYNFWGISPEGMKSHPFAGVRTFKTGFGGELLELQHCVDIPLKGSYKLTRAFELARKWKRGF